jgi:hypothetical protein
MCRMHRAGIFLPESKTKFRPDRGEVELHVRVTLEPAIVLGLVPRCSVFRAALALQAPNDLPASAGFVQLWES